MLTLEQILTYKECLLEKGARHYELKCQHLWSTPKLSVGVVIHQVKLCEVCAKQVDLVEISKDLTHKEFCRIVERI